MLHTIDQDDILLQTQFWTMVLLWKQQYLGASMLILNRQSDSLADLSVIELVNMQNCFAQYEMTMKAAFDATMFNYSCLMNHGYQHTPPTPWVHWWIRPRYKSNVNFNGKRFNDTNFGYFYDRETEKLEPSKDFDKAYRLSIVTHFRTTFTSIVED